MSGAASLAVFALAAAAGAFAGYWWLRFTRLLPLERDLARSRRESAARAKELRALQHLAEAIEGRGEGTQQALSALVALVARTLDADLAALLLYDAATGELIVQPGAVGLEHEELLYRVRLDEEGSSSARVFKTGEPFLSGDAQKDPAVLSFYARLWGIHSLMVVPVRHEGRTLGVLRLGSRKRDHFDREQLELARVVGDQAAVLVDTAILNEKLAHAAEQMQAANRMKDEFVSTVSHEFKTPLTTISGFLTVLLDGEAGPLNDQQRRFLETSQAAARRLGTLVSELLDLSKLQGGVVLEMKPLELEAIARASVERHEPQAREAGRTLRWQADGELPRALGDASWLGLVFDNLLSNAVKFTRPGGVIELRLRGAGRELEVCVEDDGIGIAPEDLPRVFDKFYRARNTQTVSVPGTGLGLAIAREVVSRHGGRLWAESEPGRGSRFLFTLPAAPARWPAASRAGIVAAALALLATGCAERRVRPGAHKAGIAVEAEGRAEAAGRGRKEALAAAAAAAERGAVASLLELYSPPEVLERSSATVEARVLSRARSFVKKRRSVSESVQGGAAVARHRVLIDAAKLSRELDQAGLVRPDGVRDRPRVMIALREVGPGGENKGLGLASDGMRRALMEQGYAVVDFSDPLNAVSRRKGGEAEALGAAKKLGAQVLVTGTAAVASSPEERLALYHPFEAALEFEASWLDGSRPPVAVSQKARAVDLDARASAAKALDSAGQLAARRLRETLGQEYKERQELTVAVTGIGLRDLPRLLGELRGLPGVVGAALDRAQGKDARLKVFVERVSADELAALMLRARSFRFDVRAVEPDFRYVELSVGGAL